MKEIGTGVRLALALGAFALAGCRAPTPLRDGQQEAEEARASYVRACASCHGLDGRGDGPMASCLRVPPADLTLLSARHGGAFPRDFVLAVIAGERAVPSHGTREMPVWSQRFGADTGASAAASLYARRHLELLTDYVESLQRTP
jgi:mono/diheme cytochrome c family protein